MKKNLLFVFLVAISVPFMAQQSVNQKEIGLITNNFDTFGLSHKVGTSESLWRFSAFNLSGSNPFGQYNGSLITRESTSKNTGIGYNLSSTPILFTISYKLN